MFEAAELGSKVAKEVYEREVPGIRTDLIALQKELATSKLRVILVVGGVEGAGKAATVNRLLEWMDARGIQVHAMWNPTDEEKERPPMWRFWRVLPPSGSIGIFFGSWYTEPIIGRVFGKLKDPDLEQALRRIVDFEDMLHAENTLVLKFWMHLSKGAQKKRLQRLEKDAQQSWRVTKMDWEFFDLYDDFRKVSERVIGVTSTGTAPWHIVEGRDTRYRTLAVTRTLRDRLRDRLAELREARPVARKPDLPKPKEPNLLSMPEGVKPLTEEKYDKELLKHTGAISRATRQLYESHRSMLLVFEGFDAAGKGGAIRRLTAAMDARLYQVISIAAPTDEERARPYLWRFWRQLPRLGRVTIFDRSWYGRVLVERIEGFCSQEEWKRAFGEINAFEQQITDYGIFVLKFWLNVSPDEQLKRFKSRETTPFKQYKLTEEDWRNREKWDAYVAAACEMIERTGTGSAPWIVVPADDKNAARIQVMKTVARALKKEVRGA